MSASSIKLIVVLSLAASGWLIYHLGKKINVKYQGFFQILLFLIILFPSILMLSKMITKNKVDYIPEVKVSFQDGIKNTEYGFMFNCIEKYDPNEYKKIEKKFSEINATKDTGYAAKASYLLGQEIFRKYIRKANPKEVLIYRLKILEVVKELYNKDYKLAGKILYPEYFGMIDDGIFFDSISKKNINYSIDNIVRTAVANSTIEDDYSAMLSVDLFKRKFMEEHHELSNLPYYLSSGTEVEKKKIVELSIMYYEELHKMPEKDLLRIANYINE